MSKVKITSVDGLRSELDAKPDFDDIPDVDLSNIRQVPSGGATSEALRKNSGTDGDYAWKAVRDVPGTGTVGQAVRKTGSNPTDFAFANVHEVPSGGSSRQGLLKNDGADYNHSWLTIHEVPLGGATDQTIRKNSGADNDYTWRDVHEIPPGGSAKQVLTKVSNTSYDVAWTTPVVYYSFSLHRNLVNDMAYLDVFFSHVASSAFVLDSTFSTFVGRAVVLGGSSNTMTFNINKNSTVIGTGSYTSATGLCSFTNTTGAPVSFAKLDIFYLTLTGGFSTSPAVADLGMTFEGVRP